MRTAFVAMLPKVVPYAGIASSRMSNTKARLDFVNAGLVSISR